MAVDWSSLPGDLLRSLGDHHLAAGDIDCYMDMRSVCQSWRSAIPKPRPLGVSADLRFRPRHWVMLDEKESKVAIDGRRLFVNVSTGRFLRRRVPMLHDHHLLAASDGLLVLRGKSSPHVTRVVDPFTGSVLLGAPEVHEDEHMMTVYFVADPASGLRTVQFPHYSDDRPQFYVRSKVVHAGHVYVLDSAGCVFRILDTGNRPSFVYGELITRMDFVFYGSMYYLVESAGELLLVRLHRSTAQVYKVDVERKVLECLHSIGRRALFLGFTRCLSVDADKFPSIHPNCLYLGQIYMSMEMLEYRYDLSNGGRQEDVSDGFNVNPTARLIGPVSFSFFVHDYCNFLAD
ncbi:unnamed protein product [Alopecurus aequalis]